MRLCRVIDRIEEEWKLNSLKKEVFLLLFLFVGVFAGAAAERRLRDLPMEEIEQGRGFSRQQRDALLLKSCAG